MALSVSGSYDSLYGEEARIVSLVRDKHHCVLSVGLYVCKQHSERVSSSSSTRPRLSGAAWTAVTCLGRLFATCVRPRCTVD